MAVALRVFHNQLFIDICTGVRVATIQYENARETKRLKLNMQLLQNAIAASSTAVKHGAKINSSDWITMGSCMFLLAQAIQKA